MHRRPAGLRILAALTTVVSACGSREQGADLSVPSVEYVAMPGRPDVPFSAAMLADMAEWGARNQEYLRHFPAGLPARSAFGTSGLALGARIELECLAVARAG